MSLNLTTAAAKGKTLASIGAAIANAANRTSQLFDSTGRMIDKLDKFTEHSNYKQTIRYKKERRQFAHNTVREAAAEKSEADIKVQEFRAKSEQHAHLFDSALAEFEDLFAEELGITPSTTPEA